MKKLTATLIAGLFATAAYAQSPAKPVAKTDTKAMDPKTAVVVDNKDVKATVNGESKVAAKHEGMDAGAAAAVKSDTKKSKAMAKHDTKHHKKSKSHTSTESATGTSGASGMTGSSDTPPASANTDIGNTTVTTTTEATGATGATAGAAATGATSTNTGTNTGTDPATTPAVPPTVTPTVSPSATK